MEQSKILGTKLVGTGLEFTGHQSTQTDDEISSQQISELKATSGEYTSVSLPGNSSTPQMVKVKSPKEIACPNMLHLAQPGQRAPCCLGHGCAGFKESVMPHPDDLSVMVRVWSCGMLPNEVWNIFA